MTIYQNSKETISHKAISRDRSIDQVRAIIYRACKGKGDNHLLVMVEEMNLVIDAIFESQLTEYNEFLRHTDDKIPAIKIPI